jgi:hypothetical protein
MEEAPIVVPDNLICPILKQTLADPTTKCIICLETWSNLEPQVVKLLPCTHLLWYVSHLSFI